MGFLDEIDKKAEAHIKLTNIHPFTEGKGRISRL